MSTQGKNGIVVIAGARGNQGGSVAETMYKENHRLRLLTRHPEDFPRDLFPKAEICVCDMKKKEDMMRAFKDAECAFAVTQFWEEEVLRDPELEIKEGKNMADAAMENKVQHFVFSALDNVKDISKGRYTKVHHFDNKAKIAEHIKQINLHHTFVYPGFFIQNMTDPSWKMVVLNDRNEIEFRVPCKKETQVPILNARRDMGPVVAHIFKNRHQYMKKRINVAAEFISFERIAEEFMKVTGRQAKVVQIPDNEFMKGKDQEIRMEMLQMFKYFEEFGYYGGNNDLSEVKKMHPSIQTWEEFLRKTGWRGPEAREE